MKGNNIMKKYVVLLLLFVVILFSACGTREEYRYGFQYSIPDTSIEKTKQFIENAISNKGTLSVQDYKYADDMYEAARNTAFSLYAINYEGLEIWKVTPGSSWKIAFIPYHKLDENQKQIFNKLKQDLR